jgi:hypothetical protein
MTLTLEGICMAEPSPPKRKKPQISKLLRSVLGPAENWDEATADFVLEMYGIDPRQSKARFTQSIDNWIRRKEERGEEVSESLRELQSFLRKQ